MLWVNPTTVGVGNKENPFPTMRSSDRGCGKHFPFRIVPDLGQLLQDCLNASGEEPRHVFRNDVLRPDFFNESDVFIPQSAPCSFCDPFPFPSKAHVLAREASAQHIREFADLTFTWPQYEKIKKEQGEEAANTALVEASKAGKIIIKDVIADAFLQNTLLIPEEYSVIATLNLNGDYISDQLAAMVGGIGIAPGANINYNSGHAIFEATHGTAPNIAGKNLVNPSSLLLSSVMMLEYMGWSDAANLITSAMEQAFSAGEATHDLARFMPNGKSLGTKEFGDRIISIIETIKLV